MEHSSTAPEISLVIESYNLGEGQSLRALERALAAADRLVAQGAAGEALLVDAGADARISALLSQYPRVRHERCPGDDYDALKDAGARLARGRIVAYLDGDCVPAHPDWLDTLVAPLRAGTALATCGTTVYESTGILGALTTAMDFAFVIRSPGGPVGCYPSNNVAFLRDLRVAVRPPDGPMRCRCYAHALHLARAGTPIEHVPEALVWHEPPALFKERYRRGYDLIAACWVDPLLPEARWLRWSVLAAPRFYLQALRVDWQTLDARHPQLALSSWRHTAAKWLAPLMRLIDLAGMFRALALGPGRPLLS